MIETTASRAGFLKTIAITINIGNKVRVYLGTLNMNEVLTKSSNEATIQTRYDALIDLHPIRVVRIPKARNMSSKAPSSICVGRVSASTPRSLPNTAGIGFAKNFCQCSR